MLQRERLDKVDCALRAFVWRTLFFSGFLRHSLYYLSFYRRVVILVCGLASGLLLIFYPSKYQDHIVLSCYHFSVPVPSTSITL